MSFFTRLTFSADRSFWHRQGRSSRATCATHPRSCGLHALRRRWGTRAERSASLQNCFVLSFPERPTQTSTQTARVTAHWQILGGQQYPFFFLKKKRQRITLWNPSYSQQFLSVFSLQGQAAGRVLPRFPACLPRLEGQWELSEEMLQLEIQEVTGRHVTNRPAIYPPL